MQVVMAVWCVHCPYSLCGTESSALHTTINTAVLHEHGLFMYYFYYNVASINLCACTISIEMIYTHTYSYQYLTCLCVPFCIQMFPWHQVCWGSWSVTKTQWHLYTIQHCQLSNSSLSPQPQTWAPSQQWKSTLHHILHMQCTFFVCFFRNFLSAWKVVFFSCQSYIWNEALPNLPYYALMLTSYVGMVRCGHS